MEEEINNLRPSKKQRELLNYIEEFIAEHGYSPSYREIMRGLDYTSVATVSLHVKNLILRGHLRKRGRSARSLEVVNPGKTLKSASKAMANAGQAGEQGHHETWLVDTVHSFISELEKEAAPATAKLDQLYVLLGALKVLGLHEATNQLLPRLTAIKEKAES